MPRLVLGESCTASIKDFAIFPPHQKKKFIFQHTPILTVYIYYSVLKLLYVLEKVIFIKPLIIICECAYYDTAERNLLLRTPLAL